MVPLAEQVARARRRLVARVLLQEGLGAGAVALCLAGAGVLAGRRLLGWGAAASGALVGLSLVALAVALALRLRGRLPDARAAATWLDLRGGGAGWVVSGLERPDPAWSSRAEAAIPSSLPPASPGPGAWAPPLGALSFVVLALLVPLRDPEAPPAPTVHPAEALAEKKAALEELVALPEEQAELLEEALDNLAESDPRSEAALEAADALDHELDQLASAAAEAAAAAEQALEGEGVDPGTSLGAAAQALGLDPGTPSGERPATPRLPSELERALKEAAAQAAAGQPMGTQAAQELSDALREALEEAQKELVSGQLVPAEGGSPGPGEGAESGDGEGAEGEGDGDGDGEGEAGRGGRGRGPGVAPLSFGDASPEDEALYAPQAIPAARFSDAEHSELLQSGLADPAADPGQGGAATGTLGADPGSAAGQRTLSPSQREAVGAFFGE